MPNAFADLPVRENAFDDLPILPEPDIESRAPIPGFHTVEPPARSPEELAGQTARGIMELRKTFTKYNPAGTSTTFGEALMTPLVKLPTITGQDVSDALSVLGAAGVATGGGIGTPTPERSRQAWEMFQAPSTPPNPAEQVAAGTVNVLKSVPEAFTSPVGAAAVLTGGAPIWLQRLTALGFTADMLRHSPESWRKVGEVWDTGTTQEKTEALEGALLNTGMVLGAGSHALTPNKIQLSRALAKQIADADLREPTKTQLAAPVEARDVPQQLEKAIEPEPIKPTETEAEATARFRKETEDAAREMIAEEVARIDATKLKGAEDVAAQQLTKLLRRAGRFEALRPALPEAFKKVADSAREQGADLDAVQRGIGAEMQSIYGADAPEMIEFYFGKGKTTKGAIPNVEQENLRTSPNEATQLAEAGGPLHTVDAVKNVRERFSENAIRSAFGTYQRARFGKPPSESAGPRSVEFALFAKEFMRGNPQAVRAFTPTPEPPIVPKPTEQAAPESIFIKASKQAPASASDWPKFPDKEGYRVVFSPYGQEGRKPGFYYQLKSLRETITPAEDTSIGRNAAGEQLYERKGGSIYRMRTDRPDRPNGYPDFGGDLAKVEPAPEPPVAKSATSAEVPAPAQPATPTTQPAQPGLPLDVEGVARQPKGIASGVRAKWTSATESPLGGEGGFISLAPIEDFLSAVTKGMKGMGRGVKSAYDMTRAAAKENFELAKTSDYRRAILHWSAKMQRSFSEAEQAQRELRSVIKDPIRRDAATNWIQAGGDPVVLQNRLRATIAWRDPVTGKPHPEAKRLIAGYEAALNLTPEEIAASTDAKNAYDALGARGAAHDVLKSFKDNYVTQVWDLKQGPTGGNAGIGFGARTLKERFRFSKASTFPTYFDGEQAGFVPKTKDISQLLPMYLHEMNNVIAARQLVEQLSKGVASDGRPLIAPRGTGIAVDNAQGKATLILPDVMKADTEGYVRMENQPALHDWQWQTKDSAGKPVLMKSDLVVHPEAAGKFKNVLGKSAITEWYQSKTSASAELPKALVKIIDRAQAETKATMLGLLAPFHQVQEGSHAIGHRVNPSFNNPTIDLVKNPAQMDAARHGLMLQPDRVSAQQFMEGFKQSGLVSKIPGIGPLADHYAHYLFHEYIPGIKFKTYEKIVDRNMKVFAKELASGKVTREDVKILSAEQANAAYGHLNYADLGRNPTVQHLMRLGLLAPDFLEARARFTGQAIKGLAGGKVGREQLIALATLAVAQAALSFISAKLTGGEWDAKDPFTFHVGNRKFTMRSVPEDLVRFATDTRAFTYARLNPIVGRGAAQYVTGVDWRGRKVSAGQTTKELLQQPIPLTLRPLFGIGNTPLSGWEELAGAAGLKISRYSNVAEMSKMAHEWMDKSTDPRIKAAEQQSKQETLPESLYKPLREALIKNDYKTARMELKKLEEIRKPSEIQRAMHMQRPFTGSLSVEQKFKASLTPDERLKYEAARREQTELYQKFLKLK